jgi:hypothetical protein
MVSEVPDGPRQRVTGGVVPGGQCDPQGLDRLLLRSPDAGGHGVPGGCREVSGDAVRDGVGQYGGDSGLHAAKHLPAWQHRHRQAAVQRTQEPAQQAGRQRAAEQRDIVRARSGSRNAASSCSALSWSRCA